MSTHARIQLTGKGLLLATCMTVALSAIAAPPKYKLSLIPKLEGWWYAFPSKINNAGQVLGELERDNQIHTFLYANRVTIDIKPVGEYYVSPNDINETGTIVGSTEEQAYKFENGQFTLLEAPGYELKSASDVNNKGQIIGRVLPVGSSSYQGFLYDNGNISVLPTGSFNFLDLVAINESGTIVGNGHTDVGSVPFIRTVKQPQ